jgi:ribonuclease HI
MRPKISQFLYNAIHGTQKVGRYWLHIENAAERANCLACGEIEPMGHILTECTHPTRKQLWDLAENTWPHGSDTWPTVKLRLNDRSGTTHIPQTEHPGHHRKRPRKQPPPGATRLLRSETAHLIWVLRCERTIQNAMHTPSEAKR